MKSEFEKVLSHCQNRIQNENVQILQISNGNIVKGSSAKNGVDSSSVTVRPGIQDFIKQKSEENKKELSDEKHSDRDKSKILFSLKDFLDNTSSSKESTDGPNIQDEDQEIEEDDIEDDVDLDENDESLKDNSFNNSNDSPKEEIDLADIDSDIEELERVDQSEVRKGEDDLESEITKLENLQRKINDNLKGKQKEEVTVNDTVLLKMKKNPTTTASVDDDCVTVEEVSTECKDSSNQEIPPPAPNVKVDTPTPDIKNAENKVTSAFKSSTLPEGMFRNISISVVGGANKNVGLKNVWAGKPGSSTPSPVEPSSNSKTQPGSSAPSSKTAPPTSKPNQASVGAKRPASATSSSSFDTKRFKNSSIVITSSRQDSPSPSASASVKSNEDNPNVVPDRDESSKFDICSHPGALGYMCHDCSLKRWKTGFDFVKTRKQKVVENVSDEVSNKVPSSQNDKSSEAADILKNVNWQQVFSFAGISIGQSSSAEEIKA